MNKLFITALIMISTQVAASNTEEKCKDDLVCNYLITTNPMLCTEFDCDKINSGMIFWYQNAFPEKLKKSSHEDYLSYLKKHDINAYNERVALDEKHRLFFEEMEKEK
ncbi:MAG: hypothetical protein KZQ70_09145 [gamma proteobacterium symbiont of Lucinoma myriamae]|nr:hypothetical protein [gamma proteobacterium symbiont of Lucinoma myriamae]MCU7818935.1 hypothetical protein [gamma proteobacterium symbiont of Lucinoma myriamae]